MFYVNLHEIEQGIRIWGKMQKISKKIWMCSCTKTSTGRAPLHEPWKSIVNRPMEIKLRKNTRQGSLVLPHAVNDFTDRGPILGDEIKEKIEGGSTDPFTGHGTLHGS